uniref:ATP-binding cassette domain-containing protein n=1 Tax=Ignisphaera aggregans TaxID=334771 RepID=A0A7C4FBB4_9CREN
MRKPFLQTVNLCKRFGDVIALSDVSLDVYPGEVLIVLGENGSGKSTLAKILYGLYFPDKGYIKVEGISIVFSSPMEAKRKGIFLVSQRPQLIDDMTILENVAMFLGEPPSRDLRKRLYALLNELGITVDIDRGVHTLSYTEKQFVDLAKVLMARPRLLIVDEAATYLPRELKQRFLNIVKGLRAKGSSVMYITHKIGEAIEMGDRFAVLRRGSVVGVFGLGVDASTLRQAMFGSEEYLTRIAKGFTQGAPQKPAALSVENLLVFDEYGKPAVNGVTLTVGAGEIVTIVGIAGNGQKELGEAVVGLRRVSRGRVRLNGVDVTHMPACERVRRGLVYVPEDPFREGVAMGLTIAENMKLFSQTKVSRELLETVTRKLDVRPSNPLVAVAKLSGGNVQKVSLSRLLLTTPKAVVAYSPTRMLDEKSRVLALNMLQRLADAGSAVLLLSEDLEEALHASTRVCVMVSGRIVRVFEGPDLEGYREVIERVMVHA